VLTGCQQMLFGRINHIRNLAKCSGGFRFSVSFFFVRGWIGFFPENTEIEQQNLNFDLRTKGPKEGGQAANPQREETKIVVKPRSDLCD